MLMDAYNHLVLVSDTKRMIDRLRWHWDIDLKNHHLDDCTQCGQCESLCTQKLPICERIKFIQAQIEKFLASEKRDIDSSS